MWKGRVTTVPKSQGSGVNSLHSIYRTGYLGRICSKAISCAYIPSKKPAKDLLPYMLDGPCTFTNTRLRHEDKGDEQRKRLASSSCVKGGIVRRLEIYHLLVLKKSSNHRPVG